MRAGKLRHRIEIQRATQSQSASGVMVRGAPQTIATRWAEVKALSGREAERAKQVKAETTHQVTLRYYSDLQTTDQFLFDGKALHILSIIPDERKTQQVCLCVEVQ